MTKEEEQILKDIEAGKYCDFYIIYNRKSTDEPNNQKNSLSFQKTTNLKFAIQNNLPIAPIVTSTFFNNGVISEKHSASKQKNEIILNDNGTVQFSVERPKFHKMCQMLNKKLFKGVIFLLPDRASRNSSDRMIIKKLEKNGVDIRYAFVKYEKNSSGSLHQDIDGILAENIALVTSEKVTEHSK